MLFFCVQLSRIFYSGTVMVFLHGALCLWKDIHNIQVKVIQEFINCLCTHSW